MKKNNNKIIGALIGSIAVLAGMISYAAINNQGVEERAIKKAQAKKIESTSRALAGSNDIDGNIQITEQSRIDKLDSVSDGSYYAKKESTYPTTQILERYASTEVGPQTSELYRFRNEETPTTTQKLDRYASTEAGSQTSQLYRFKEESTPSYSVIAERPQNRNDQPTTHNNETIVNNDAPQTNNNQSNNVPQTNNDYSNNANIDKPVVDIGTDTDQPKPSRPGSTDFSQYVYEDNGYVCFKYTGSGDSHIIVPEGVEWIKGFVESATEFNTDITSIELPSTLKKMSMYCMFGYVDGDTNWYNCFYQCKNLQSVTGLSIGYTGNGSSVTRPGNITVWSRGKRIPYDEQAYKFE